MEKFEQMDDLFRRRLGHYASDVPAGTWANIQARRKPAADRRWLFLLLLLVGSSALGLGWWTISQAELEAIPNTRAALTLEQSASPGDRHLAAAPVSGRSTSRQEMQETGSEPTLSAIVAVSSENRLQKVSDKQTADRPGRLDVFQTSGGSAGPIAVAGTEAGNTAAEKQVEITRSTPDQLPVSLLKELQRPLDRLSLPDPESCYSFGRKATGIRSVYLDLQAGPGLAFRTLENPDPANELGYYLDARDSTESSWYALNALARLSMVYDNGLALRAGFAYTRFNEIFEYTSEREVRTTVIDVFDANGNLLRRDTIREQGRRYKKTYNDHTLLEVPLMAGYEWSSGDWTFSINAGPQFNIRLRSNGEILDEGLQPAPMTTDAGGSATDFKGKVGISALGSVNIAYRLGGRFSLTAEPWFRYYPNSFSNGEFLDQRYSAAGCNLGVRIDLLKKD